MTDFATILDGQVDGFLRSRSGTVDIAARVVAELQALADDNEVPARRFVVPWKPYPSAPWGSSYPFANAPEFDTREEADLEASLGDHGCSMVVSYLIEHIGPTISLPADVPAEAPAARVTG